jgi:hypothetical protein
MPARSPRPQVRRIDRRSAAFHDCTRSQARRSRAELQIFAMLRDAVLAGWSPHGPGRRNPAFGRTDRAAGPPVWMSVHRMRRSRQRISISPAPAGADSAAPIESRGWRNARRNWSRRCVSPYAGRSPLLTGGRDVRRGSCRSTPVGVRSAIVFRPVLRLEKRIRGGLVSFVFRDRQTSALHEFANALRAPGRRITGPIKIAWKACIAVTR